MKSTGTTIAATALTDWLAALDAEAWDVVADWLDKDVQLADELTTGWLRGHERVGAYLRASEGIVTDIVSTPWHLTVSDLGPDNALITFTLHQRYRLDGVERSENSTGSAIFGIRDDRPRLVLFHLAPVPSVEAEPATDSALDQPVESVAEVFVLGEEIKRRRAAADLSLRKLSERTGLSPSFLSQVERSLADPSVSSLRQIAGGLGIDMLNLLGRDRGPSSSSVREGLRGERARFLVGESGVTVEGFAGFVDGALEAYIAEPAPRHAGLDLVDVPGAEEFLYVLSGTVELESGQRSLVLHAGDGAHVRSAIPHRVSPGLGAPTRYLVVRTRART